MLHHNQSVSPELEEKQYNAGELINLVWVTPGMLGTSVSHYEIVKKLGEGGMGVVYQARDMTLDRYVALKFLHPHLLESAEQIARFEQEARVISTLNHPNIATIHGIEQSEERRFMVLEYLPGGTLAARLAALKSAGTDLSIQQALDCAIQIALGLKHAHDRGVVHRDIKASNVMFTDEGGVKLTDFGLAMLAEGLHVTEHGIVVGTPPCMSPEQALGKPLDPRSDIFSFGILLYRLIGGAMPFRAPNTPALLHQIVYDEPLPLSRCRDGIPDALEQIVAKALEKDPEFRYQSMGSLLDDLREVSRGTGSARTASRASQETVTVRSLHYKRRRVWGIGGAVLLGAMIAAMFVLPQLRERTVQLLHPEVLPQEKRIAVLPFEARDPANQAFSDGLNDMISYKLAQLEQFHGSLLVVAASEVNTRGVKTPSAARNLLGANLAIMGTVVRSGDQFQAMVSLVDTGKLVHLRSAAIDARLSEITTFRERVMSKVAQMLDLELSAAAQKTLLSGETSVSTAYGNYTEGRGYLQRFDRPGNLERAISLFQQSVAKDPKYALAYAGMAEAYLKKYDNITKDPRDVTAADANCSRAIELNGELEPVHIMMGRIQSAKGGYEKAEAEFRRVLTLNPASAGAYRGLGDTYDLRSRPKEAEEAYKKVVELRPNDWTSYNLLGTFYFSRGPYTEAERCFKRVEELTPDNFWAYTNLGATYLRMGRSAEALTMFQKSISLNPTGLTYSNLGMVGLLEGRYTEAAEWLQKAVDFSPTNETYWGNLGHARRWDPTLAAKAPEAFRRAIELGERRIDINPRDANLHARLATYWAALGDKQKSLSSIARALAIEPKSGYVQFRAAAVYEQGGDRKRALRAVRSALDSSYSLEEVQKSPALKKLREDSRYRNLLQSHISTTREAHN